MPQRWLKDWSICHTGRNWEVWGCSVWRGLRRKRLMQGEKTTEPDFPSDAQWQQSHQDSYQENWLLHWKSCLNVRIHFDSDSGHTLKQVACRISIVRDLQILTGHSPEQGLDLMSSRDAFSLSCFLSLWFCHNFVTSACWWLEPADVKDQGSRNASLNKTRSFCMNWYSPSVVFQCYSTNYYIIQPANYYSVILAIFCFGRICPISWAYYSVVFWELSF